MKQEQQYLSSSLSLQNTSQPPAAWQDSWWGFFWPNALIALPQLFWLVPVLMYAWWHIPFYIPLPILLVGYVVLMILAWRSYRRFKKRTQSSPEKRMEQAWDQPLPPERSRATFVNPPPAFQDHEQFLVPYPEQE